MSNRRNGMLSLYAALDVKTGKVQGNPAKRHTGAEFVGFLEQIISNQVERFLKQNANVNLHFSPTYSSWLN